jgi:hypothetical protein
VGARTTEALYAALTTLVAAMIGGDATRYFHHRGYAVRWGEPYQRPGSAASSGPPGAMCSIV